MTVDSSFCSLRLFDFGVFQSFGPMYSYHARAFRCSGSVYTNGLGAVV